ncbi:MAG TPA: phosphoenolpyruvate carboxykinase [Dehalococcoidia bacterium]|nr:phosphoenolpyruvate carboxykinase [Dehalococcoidia bacterium]
MVSIKQSKYAIEAKVIHDNPSHKDLRQFTAQMENAHHTVLGNLDVFTRVDSRSSASTYIVTDNPEDFHGLQTMPRAEYEQIADMQNTYIRGQEMIVIDGYISNAPEVQTAARLIIERTNANVAGMQKYLYFERRGGEPQVTVIDTPNLVAEGYPSDTCIAVDLDNGVTRVLHSDYFGESKKGGLRMWNKIVFDKGGLPMHAGAKVVNTERGPKTIVIIGLSGTGKTTSTFRKQGDSKPVQDDFVALMPGGIVHGTENGCFAKTFALSPEQEPEIHAAVTSPIAYLENVYIDDDGNVDFFNESFTQNGRAVFPLKALGRYEDARNIPPTTAIVILNRDTGIVPALARLTQKQAAAYFMLGETTGTSAGGKAEAGKALRVPGTNPFFPMPHARQGNRFHELLEGQEIEVYLMNTGWVVDKTDDDSKKVKVADSSVCLTAIAEGGVEWETDPDFGYEVPKHLDGIDPELVRPRLAFERLGREDEYIERVAIRKTERREFLQTFPGLDPEIVDGV